jgi:hypothetical protein
MATAQVTGAGLTLGTISYMSPEQAAGDDLDGRTDIFSLGAALYECATGQHPFPGRTSTAMLAGILNKTPIAPVELNPDLPIRLQEIIQNCLEKDRELRYQSAADLRADLKRLRRELESGQSRSMDRTSSPRSAAQRGPRSAALSGAGHIDDRPEPAGGASPHVGRRTAVIVTVGVLIVAAVAAGIWYTTSRQQPVTVEDTTTAAVPATPSAAETRLPLARASFASGNYRAAAMYATEILALTPEHPEARQIRDDSQAMLARFDEALRSADEQLRRGDLSGAAAALDAARRVDPSAPSLLDLSSRLAEQMRVRDERAASRSAPPPSRESRPQPPPADARANVQVTPPPPARAEPPSPPPIAPAPTVAPPAAPPSAATAKPPVVPAPVAPPTVAPPTVERTPAAPTPAAAERAAAERDQAAIRQIVARYGRAIETKDMALFRAIKPNLSADEERRLQEGFRAVTSQRVSLNVVSIDHQGDAASVLVQRHDTIRAGGREQTADSQQLLRFARTASGWVIVEIR